ncbi:hypothetical protein [Peribacillus frigoritolerans]|uniref:hypothetical protein n=1 Tax=Peribacillus castrilensis TaxID=2897690 RepID=UPI002DC77A88|nr:hypothetical protein [Peribacillus castrilensis]
MLKPHTQGFIACLIAVIFAALTIWFKTGTVNLELIIFFYLASLVLTFSFLFIIVEKVKTRFVLQQGALC